MKRFLLLLAVLSPCAHAAVDEIFADGMDTVSTACVDDPQRIRMGNITVGYSVWNVGNLPVDATQFQPIFGRASVNDPVTIPFTGISGAGPVLHWIYSHQYYSGVFHTPPVGRYVGSLAFQSNDSRGCFDYNGHPSVCGQPWYDVSISRTCNDYSGSAAYVSNNVPSDGQPHLRWSMGYVTGDLQPNTDYYLNIRMHDPNDYWHMVYMIWYAGVPN